MWSFVGKLGDDSVEFVEGDSLIWGSFLIDVSAVQQLQKIVIIEVLVQLLWDGFEFFEINETVLVSVKLTEDSLQTGFGLGLTNSCSDNAQELLEGDGVVNVSQTVDEGQNEGVSLFKAEFFQNLVDLGGINAATVILVKDFKGILEIFVVLVGQSVFPGSGSSGFSGLGRLGFGGSAHKICKNDKWSLENNKI